jgi:hypothetical protein
VATERENAERPLEVPDKVFDVGTVFVMNFEWALNIRSATLMYEKNM